MKKLYILLITTFVLQLAARAEAASLELSCSIDLNTLSCDNSGVYTLKGVGFVNVSGIEVVIQYDPGSLQSPQIIKGPLLRPAMVTNNLKHTSSSVKIAAGSSPSFLNGTDVLATVRFNLSGARPGNVSIQTSSLATGLSANQIQHSIKNPSNFIAEASARENERLRLEKEKAAKAAEEARLAEEKAAKEAADKRLAEEKAARDAEEARLAAEKAAKEAEDARIAAEKAAREADAEKAAKAAEEARLAAEKAAKDAADAENAARVAEEKRIAAEKAAKDAEEKRIAAEKAARDKADADAKARAAAAAAALAQANAAGASVAVAGVASVGTISLPSDQLASTERKTEYQPLVTDLRGDMTIPLSGGETAAKTAAVKQPDKKSPQANVPVANKSVLQLFREFKGEKSAKALIALFADGELPNFTQAPPVAFSDGITPVRLTLTLKPGGGDTPKFMLQGASVQQIGSEGEEQTVWTIDALPKKGVYEARLTVIDGQSVMEFPLVVAPPIAPLVPKAQKFTEADFTLYLSKASGFDLNKDQKFDTLDDYIFTANYISALKIKPEKLKKDEPKPVEKDEVKGKGSQKTKDPVSRKEDKSK